MEKTFAAFGRGVTLVPGGDLDLDDAAIAGAAGAVCSKFMAVATPRSIGVIGGGAVARAQLAAHRLTHAPRELRTTDAALAFDEGGRLVSLAEACACDIVCVSTPVRIERAWIRNGTHLDAGPAMIDDALIHDAKIVVSDDDVTVAHMWGTLGDVAAGLKDGRELDEISIFVTGSLDRVKRAVASFLPR